MINFLYVDILANKHLLITHMANSYDHWITNILSSYYSIHHYVMDGHTMSNPMIMRVNQSSCAIHRVQNKTKNY